MTTTDVLLRQGRSADGSNTLTAQGAWTMGNAAALDSVIAQFGSVAGSTPSTLDLSGIEKIDTFGACLLHRLIADAIADKRPFQVSGAQSRFSALLAAVALVDEQRVQRPSQLKLLANVEALGRAISSAPSTVGAFLAMLGAIGAAAARTIVNPRRFRLTSTVHQLDRVGLQAVPLILLITLLIGAIIAQQGIFNFRKFGAESYVVDLVGILVLREIGVLIVAIMVAGRSGSSYTAELGSMKMREEIDALRTMGLDPVEVLVLPRVVALLLALPTLAFIGSLAALTGGGLVAWIYAGMSPVVYIARVRDAISLTHLEVGLLKAPFMALVIGVVACAEGFRVKGSSESLGLRTTSSVVVSIFLVIALDGLFAVIFASIGM